MSRNHIPALTTVTTVGYKILRGSSILSPRRRVEDLGLGSELWRMSTSGLLSMENTVKAEAWDSGVADRDYRAIVNRKLAGARAEARSGYSVDGHHEWASVMNQHTMYMTPAAARVAAATSTLEDVRTVHSCTH